MKLHRLLAIASLFVSSSALAQNAGTVTNHAFALGKGPGVTGYTSLLCGSAQLAVGQSAADPICKTITGDVTITAPGVTAIGTNKVLDTMLRQGVARSVIGVTGNGTSNVADIQGATDTILRVNGAGTALAFGAIDLSKSAAVGATILPPANGGTGLSTFAIGDLLQASSSSALARLAAVATGNVLISGGVGTVSSWGKVGLTTHVSGILPIANGGTNASSASGTALDNITGFASTGFLTRTGAGTYAFQSTTNGIVNSNLATMGAFTFKGNNTSGTAGPTDVDIHALTLKASPAATDEVIISDQAASGAWKRVAVSSLASAGSVSSIDTATGAFTISGLLARSSQDLRVTAVAKSDQTTATSNVLAVTPLHQQDHPSATKFSISCTLSGTTATLRDQYNLNGGGGGSCGRSAVGTFTPTFNTAFATAFYTCVAGTNDRDRNATVSTKTTTTLTVQTGTAGGALGDFSFDVICTGTQ